MWVKGYQKYVAGGHRHSGISAASVPRFAVRLAQWTGRAACPGVAAFIAFAAKAKSARFESAGASNLHTLPFGFNPGDATGTQGIGV